MIHVILLAVLGGDGGCLGEKFGAQLVEEARQGDDCARRKVERIMRRSTESVSLSDLEAVPALMTTPKDIWAETLLRETALGDATGLGSFALIAWWRIHEGKKRDLAAMILDERSERMDIKETAMQLLLSVGDEQALKLQQAQWKALCHWDPPEQYLGLLFQHSSAIDVPTKENDVLVVEHVCSGSVAAQSGFLKGDKVVGVGKKRCSQRAECKTMMDAARATSMPFAVQVFPKGTSTATTRFVRAR